MKRSIASSLAVACFCVLAGCGGGSGSGTASQTRLTRHYKITDLGVMSQASTAKPVTRDTNSNPSGLIDLGSSAPAGLRPVRINAAGQVVGTIGSTDPGKIGLPIAGYVYSGGSVTTIGTLGGTISSARAINANGLIVGDATVAGTNEPHAFLDSNSQLTDLGTLGGTFSVATAINSSGLITGYADLPSQSNPPTLPPIEHAFLYSQGQMTDIGTLPGYAQCVPTDINDNAVIAGTAYLVPGGPDTRQLAGFVYSNGTMQDLGTLGGLWTAAYAINNAGQVVGMSTTGPLIGKNAKGQIHAYLWQNGQMSDLGTLPGGNDAVAYGVNNVGQVVGTSNTAPGSAYAHAFLWQNSQIIDLNTLIPSNSGWVLTCATDVNDKGQIVGMGNTNGQLHGFLLTPQ